MSDSEELFDISVLKDIQKRLHNLGIKGVDSNQVIEQQENKKDSASEQTTSNEHLHSELNTHTGKLVTETAGDVSETYHQSCHYQHEQETLTEIEIQKEYHCIRDLISRVTLDPVLRLCEVNQLKVAAELAAIKGHHSAHNGGGQSKHPQFYGNYSRGRGRGFGYQSNYRSRHRQQGHGRDFFHDLSGGQYSPFSPNEFAD